MASVQDIYDEITRIDNAKQGIAEAIEEKGVQVPAGTPIQNFPAKVREIQTGSPDAVLYTPQELTPEQQEQARENIGAYKKPETGIPKTDLATGVQTSLEKADAALQPGALTPITELIPAQATPQNQLADKNFVNSSVSTNTANYISDNGQPFQSVEDLEAYTGQLTNNDYAFVVGTDSAGNTIYTRYKYNANTQTWAAEYVLNNSSFTAAQWAAISSGITALLVQKLSELPTEVVTYVFQTLTDAQKEQARRNIGAAPEGGSSEIAESALSVLAQDALEAYYTFRRTADGAKIGNGLGRIAGLRGKSLARNQLVKMTSFPATSTIKGVTLTNNGDGSITINGTNDGSGSSVFHLGYISLVSGHKYILYGSPKMLGWSNYALYLSGSGVNYPVGSAGKLYFTSGVTDRLSLTLSIWANISVDNDTFYPMVIDLTLMFGAGNEPTTVAEYEVLYSLPYYAYNEGEIISNKTEAVKVTGRNQWDEDWELGGYVFSDGRKASQTDRIRNKNMIPVLPSTTYYAAIGGTNRFCVFYYDGAGTFLYYNDNKQNTTFTTPNNCAYICFFVLKTTYNHDICINISDPSFNGQYEPYKMNTVALNLTTLTGKLNGEGDSVVVFPDGLKSAGSVYDELVVDSDGYARKAIKRIAVVDMGAQEWTYTTQYDRSRFIMSGSAGLLPPTDLGNVPQILSPKMDVVDYSYFWNTLANDPTNTRNALTYCNSSGILACYPSITDAETFRTAMDGVILAYAIATPQEYTLDIPIYVGFAALPGGTERRLPEDTATVVNAPFYGTVQYPIAIQPKDTISNDSLAALLTALKSAGKIANYTMTWDAATNSYKFTIS